MLHTGPNQWYLLPYETLATNELVHLDDTATRQRDNRSTLTSTIIMMNRQQTSPKSQGNVPDTNCSTNVFIMLILRYGRGITVQPSSPSFDVHLVGDIG